MSDICFDVPRKEILSAANTGKKLLEKHLNQKLNYSKFSIEKLDEWMLDLWQNIPIAIDEITSEEEEFLGYLAAFLGECMIRSIGGCWGKTGPFFTEHYFIRIPVPSQFAYDIFPGLRIWRCYLNPIRYNLSDWYSRSLLANEGYLDPLLTGLVDQMIIPSMHGRALIGRQENLVELRQ